MKRLVRWTRAILWTTAASTLGYCGFTLIETRRFQRSEGTRLEVLRAAPVPPFAAATDVPAGGLIGRIEIPRIGLSAIVMEGTSGAILRRAAGHVSGTALPGQTGNIGISAHRDTFFRSLRHVRPGDMITLTTLQGRYRYRVTFTKIVEPTEVSVLTPGAGELLTLVTCYPFYYVGSAPGRFIVRAERVESVS